MNGRRVVWDEHYFEMPCIGAFQVPCHAAVMGVRVSAGDVSNQPTSQGVVNHRVPGVSLAVVGSCSVLMAISLL